MLICPVKKIPTESSDNTVTESQLQEDCYTADLYVNQCQALPLTYKDASALQKEYYTAGIRKATEQMETEEFLKRQAAAVAYKSQLTQMKQFIRDEAEDQNEMKSLRVYESFGKIKMDIIRPDGRVSRPKILIDEEFVEAKKFVAIDEDDELMILSFLKKGHTVKVMYNSKLVGRDYANLLALLKAHGLHVNVSRRLKTEIEESLYFFFEEIADVEKVPLTFGYHQESDGKWHLAKPGVVTVRSLKRGDDDE